MKRLFLILAVVSGASAQNWDSLVDRYFDEAYFPFSPSQATSAGFHQYDTRLEDFSRSAIDRQISVLRRIEGEVQAFPPSNFSASQVADRELVLSQIRSSLLDLEKIRYWETNPDKYSSAASNAAFVIMSRRFAPPADRMRSLIARERLMPKMFEQARANLKNPPRVFTQVALEQLPGIISFFEKDVPAAFQGFQGGVKDGLKAGVKGGMKNRVKDKALLDQFHSSNAAVIQALQAYQQFLDKELLPKSNGDFRLGAENYRRKLLFDEMVDLPLERLLQIGYDNLHLNQQRFRETAAKIDGKRTPQQILEEAEKNHPAPAKLLDAFRNTLGGLADFIRQHHIISIPSAVLPILEETPPFERALTFASMDTPGPYEKVATEAYFNVTLPEKAWSLKQVNEHMAAFNRGVIISTAIHEAYPGHYTQFLWVPSAPSKVRKLLGAASNAEGWAHYCEQMMLDEGYGGGDLKLRLGQLQDALLRNARYIVGMKMHLGQMTYEQGIDFFVKEGFQTRANGERETKRGTSDPTYLYYTLGKLQILKLRDDYRRMKGASFSLEEFHTSFLKQGFPPIKLVRHALLNNDSPVL